MSSELILLVDDEPSITQLARMYLEREGFRVLDAGDGEAALEAVAKQKPALMVLDVMLPKLDGLEVCRRLRGTPVTRGIKILVITGVDEMDLEEKARAAGADGFMRKPIDPEEFFEKVGELLKLVMSAETPEKT